MKKSIYLLLILALFVLLPFSVSADEIIGEVYTTDITAYINGYEIPAYNIGGSVAVAVADLRNYGFTVDYDNTLRQSSTYAAMLKCMVNHIGYESMIIYGEFIYKDGSTTEHLWNNILIDGKYYWFDTDLDSINWNNYYSSYDYVVKNYFMKKDSDWTSNHKWDTSYYPKCN